MIERLNKWQKKIQDVRKSTNWNDFIRDIVSRYPLMLRKQGKHLSRFVPHSDRIGTVVDFSTYSEGVSQQVLNNYGWNFFENFWELMKKSTVAGTKVIGKNENSDYNDIILWAKNAYLNFVVLESDEAAYSYGVNQCEQVYNSTQVLESQQIFSSRAVTKSSRVFYSSNIQDSFSIWFWVNLTGCSECIWCSNLNNQSYCIQNKQYSKEEYLNRKEQLLSQKDKFPSLHGRILSQPWSNYWTGITGQFNRLCQDVDSAFFNFQVHTWRNIMFGAWTGVSENIFDVFSFGWTVADHNYWCMWVWREATHVYCCVEASPRVSHCFYSYLIDNCSFCLWCVGISNKSYCIFNKQYSKEDWYNAVDKIFWAMDKAWTLGTFFPWWLNPFYFNDTAAHLIDGTFDKEELQSLWYLRREESIIVDIPDNVEIISVDQLGDYEERKKNEKTGGKKRHIDPSILTKVIKDKEWNVYRIIKMEYDFLMQHELPLPRLHRLDRIKLNFTLN